MVKRSQKPSKKLPGQGSLYLLGLLKKEPAPVAGEVREHFHLHQLLAQKLGHQERPLSWWKNLLDKAGNSPAIRALLQQSDNYSYSLFVHLLAHLLHSAKKEGVPQATLTIVVNNLFQSVFDFAKEKGKQVATAYAAYAAARAAVGVGLLRADLLNANRALTEAKKNFEAAFEPLATEVMIKAGLTPEALANAIPDEFKELFPVSAEFKDFLSGATLSPRIKAEMIQICADFYDLVVVPEGKDSPLAERLEDYKEGRLLLQGYFKNLMPDIKESLAKEENRRDMQAALAEEIEGFFVEKNTLPLEKEWIAQPIKELVEQSPYYQKLDQFAEPYFVDSFCDMFAHLADSYPPRQGQAKVPMLRSAMAHLQMIIVQEVKDPLLAEKLQKWMAIPDTPERQKEKSEEKLKLRDALFGACGVKVMEKAGWNNLDHIRAPKILRRPFKTMMEKVVVPDQLFRICCDMVAPKNLSKGETKTLENMLQEITVGGRKTTDLKLLSEGLAERMTPWVFSSLKVESGLFAGKLNEKLPAKRGDAEEKPWLDISQEAWLGVQFDAFFDQEKETPLWNFVERFLSQTLHDGFAQLALNSKRAHEAKFMDNITGYLRDLLKNFVLDNRLVRMIKSYQEQSKPLTVIDKELVALRNQAMKEVATNPAGVSLDLRKKLTEKKKERQEKEKELEKLYQKIMQAFEPQVKKLLNDMGFESATDLPVPYFLKNFLWKKLSTQLLPDLCLTFASKMIVAFDALTPETKEIEEYEAKLNLLHEKSLNAGEAKEGKAPLVTSVYKLSDFLVKLFESQAALKSQIALNGTELVDWGLEYLIPEFAGKERGKAHAAALHLFDNKNRRENLAKLAERETPELIGIAKERAGHMCRQVIASMLLKGTYHLMSNLEKLERGAARAPLRFHV